MLSWTKSFGYAFPALPLAIFGITAYIYIPKYYSGTFHADLVFLGSVIVGVRLWNALADPFIGSLSDRTCSFLGRRLPWMIFSLLPLALVSILFFNPGLRPDGLSVEIWFAALCFLFFTLWNAYSIPYEALGAELSNDYHERTSLLATRSGFLLLGTLTAAASPLFLESISPGLVLDRAWLLLSTVYCCLLILATVIAAFTLRSSPGLSSAASREGAGRLRDLPGLFGNQHFSVLLGAFVMSSFATSMPPALFLFYVEDVLQSSKANLFLGMYFFLGMAILPFWVWLSKKVDKRRAWVSAMLINTLAFLLIFFLGPGDELEFGLLVALSACGFGGCLAIPASMQADVIDAEELRSGQRREGQMMGVWSVARETSSALGTGLALIGLGSAGYVSSAPTHHPGELWALRALYALIPSLVSIIAVSIALFYKLDEKTFRELREKPAPLPLASGRKNS